MTSQFPSLKILLLLTIFALCGTLTEGDDKFPKGSMPEDWGDEPRCYWTHDCLEKSEAGHDKNCPKGCEAGKNTFECPHEPGKYLTYCCCNMKDEDKIEL